MAVWRGAGQGGRARRATMLLAMLLAGGCEVPKPLDPVLIYNRVSGRDDAMRPAPPGLDLPTPSLGSVPPRPERPPLDFRTAVSDALAQDRARSRDPLIVQQAAPPAAADSPGDPLVPALPPGRPKLASAPAIPWGGPAAPRRGDPAPQAEPAAPEIPDAAPALPPPELLAPPPAPRL